MTAAVIDDRQKVVELFSGFEPLDANYIYCPNQFLDVCIPNSSRGVVRLVAYVMRQTLGWLDKDGQPVEQDIAIPYSQLVSQAGISRGAIRDTIKDAVRQGFLVCVQPGKSDSSQAPAQTAQYRLSWDTGNQYAKAASKFNGFFAGEGRRTPIPNAFFDRIVRSEPLSVIKVVSAVLRHTAGYQNQFGGRRESAPLSYSFISQIAQISDGKSLAEAIKQAISAGYVRRVQKGTFGPSASQRRPAHYAINWLAKAKNAATGSKTPAVDPDQFKSPSNTGSEIPPANRFKNPRQERQKKYTYKQQPAAVEKTGFEMLTEFGFDRRTAERIADKHPVSEIRDQIQWLKHRGPQHNKLGMLRKAIEECWSEPRTSEIKRRENDRRVIDRAKLVPEDNSEREARRERKKALLSVWEKLSGEEREQHKQSAIAEEGSASLQTLLIKKPVNDDPPVAFLDACARQRGLPPVTLIANVENAADDGTTDASANPSIE